MNLEQQVCGLDLAKRLKELGVKQESYFAWCDCDVHGEYQIVGFGAADGEWRISAFSAAELGEMLPQNRVRSVFYVGMLFDEPHAHVKYAADAILRKHFSELRCRKGGNAPFTISGAKTNNLVFAMHIAIAPREITLLLHSQFLEALGEVEAAHLLFEVHTNSSC